jgi:hypothetical protein
MNGWLAILFMWSCVFIGFALATLASTFLINNPDTVRSLSHSFFGDTYGCRPSHLSSNKYRFVSAFSLIRTLKNYLYLYSLVNAMRGSFEMDSRTVRGAFN